MWREVAQRDLPSEATRRPRGPHSRGLPPLQLLLRARWMQEAEDAGIREVPGSPRLPRNRSRPCYGPRVRSERAAWERTRKATWRGARYDSALAWLVAGHLPSKPILDVGPRHARQTYRGSRATGGSLGEVPWRPIGEAGSPTQVHLPPQGPSRDLRRARKTRVLIGPQKMQEEGKERGTTRRRSAPVARDQRAETDEIRRTQYVVSPGAGRVCPASAGQYVRPDPGDLACRAASTIRSPVVCLSRSQGRRRNREDANS